MTVRAVKAWGYAERDNDLLVRHGLVIRRLSIVPYARMQFVDVTAGPLTVAVLVHWWARSPESDRYDPDGED